MFGVALLTRLIRVAFRRAVVQRHPGWLAAAALGLWMSRRYLDDAPLRQVITVKPGQRVTVTSTKPERKRSTS